MADHFKKDYGETNWYDWQNNNWGCKWGTSSSMLQEDEPEELQYSFQSPWCAPLTGLLYVSTKYPELNFELTQEDEGQGFLLYHNFRDGDMLKEIEGNCEVPEKLEEELEWIHRQTQEKAIMEMTRYDDPSFVEEELDDYDGVCKKHWAKLIAGEKLPDIPKRGVEHFCY